MRAAARRSTPRTEAIAMTDKNTTTPEPLNETQRFLLTAYVFDELTPDGRTSVEAKLLVSPSWREELESIRTAQRALNAAFASDAQTATLEMTDKQYDELMAEAERNGSVFFREAQKSKWRRKLLLISSAAAVLFLMCLAVTIPGLTVVRVKGGNRSAYEWKNTTTAEPSPSVTFATSGETTIMPDGRDWDEEADEAGNAEFISVESKGWGDVGNMGVGGGGLAGAFGNKDKASESITITSTIKSNASFRAEDKQAAAPSIDERRR